jgi:hypothetical protein
MSPGFSMHGSGIDSVLNTRSVDCDECGKANEVEFESEESAGDFEWSCEFCKEKHSSSFDVDDLIDPDANFDD